MKSSFDKLKEIQSGWSNLLTGNDDDIIKDANRRAGICSGCAKNIFNICIMCGCPLSAKTYSPISKCDLNKW